MLPIYYTSDEAGAPTLNNSAGSLISVLDACLINGWGLKPVTSITVASGVATVVCPSHQFSGGLGRKVLISGATPSVLNGNQDVTVVDANTFTFSTTAAGGTASGTITAKRAPIGWSKLYSGTNKAIYQRTDPQATSMLLRIDDTGTGVASATYARAVMVESATDVDTYSAATPTSSQLSGGFYVPKGASSTTAKRWLAVGDGRTLYLFTEGSNYTWATYGALTPLIWGDINSHRSGGDAFGCYIAGGRNNNDLNYALRHEYPESGYLARATNQITPAPSMTATGFSTATGQVMGGIGPTYPSDVDGGAVLNRMVLLRDSSSSAGTLRGTLRGLVQPFANMSAVVSVLHGTVISNLIGSPDTLLCVAHMDQGTKGVVMFNISSEW